MADEAIERIRIEASPERCFEVAVDFPRYPEWATDVKDVEVLARDDDGRGQRVRFAVAALGKTIGYDLDYEYAGAPTEFSWTLARSDVLRTLEGSYRFEPDGTATALTYRLTVDLKVPLPGFMKRTAAGLIVQNAVKGFKHHLESGAA